MARALLLVAFIALASCATPYQAAGLRGGYSEMQMRDRVYRVTFNGNGYTSPSYLQQLWLRRCAELTKESGARYFEVLQEGTESTFHVYSFSSKPTIASKPTTSGTIRIIDNETPESLDADVILSQFAH